MQFCLPSRMSAATPFDLWAELPTISISKPKLAPAIASSGGRPLPSSIIADDAGVKATRARPPRDQVSMWRLTRSDRRSRDGSISRARRYRLQHPPLESVSTRGPDAEPGEHQDQDGQEAPGGRRAHAHVDRDPDQSQHDDRPDEQLGRSPIRKSYQNAPKARRYRTTLPSACAQPQTRVSRRVAAGRPRRR